MENNLQMDKMTLKSVEKAKSLCGTSEPAPLPLDSEDNTDETFQSSPMYF
jgi:hypothetical protein